MMATIFAPHRMSHFIAPPPLHYFFLRPARTIARSASRVSRSPFPVRIPARAWVRNAWNSFVASPCAILTQSTNKRAILGRDAERRRRRKGRVLMRLRWKETKRKTPEVTVMTSAKGRGAQVTPSHTACRWNK